MSETCLVTLTDAQRQALEARRVEPLTLRQRNRVEVLLRADEGDTDAEVAAAPEVATSTVARVRRRFAADGLEAALTERARRGAPPKLDGEQEAPVIALARAPAPEGRTRWAIRRPTERVVAPEVAETTSREATRRPLRRTRSSPGGSGRGARPTAWAANPSGRWRTSWGCTPRRTTGAGPSSAPTRPARRSTARSARRSRPGRGGRPAATPTTSATGRPTCS